MRMRFHVSGIAAACLATCVAAVVAQTPAPVTVVGQVVNAVTGAPIGGAEVSLNGAPQGTPQRKAASSEDGRFMFDNIPAGKYYVFASKPGFFIAGLNDDWQHGGSDELVVAWPGPAPITMKLWPHGAITGTVSDGAGKPVAGAKVAPLVKKQVWPSWGKQLAWTQPIEIKTMVTDDRGRYAIEALDPGEYLIEVDAAAVAMPIQPPSTFGTTYSPGVHRIADAVPFALGAGERRVADIQIRARPAFDLAGMVDVPAVDFHSVSVLLFVAEGDIDQVRRPVGEQSVDAGRPFKFSRLPPGDYLLVANVNERFWGEQRVTVEDRSLGDVHVVLTPTPVVSGRVIWEGADRPPDRSSLVGPINYIGGQGLSADQLARLMADRPVDLVEMLPVGPSVPSQLVRSYSAVWTSATTFTLTAPRGRYLAGRGWATGWFVKSFRINGHEATEEPVEIESNARDAVLTLTRAVGEVRGGVVTPTGAPDPWCAVVLFSTNPRVWPGLHATQGRQVREDLADAAGRFKIEGVMSGEYYLAAINDTIVVDEDLLKRLAASAPRVQVPAGVPIERTLTRVR